MKTLLRTNLPVKLKCESGTSLDMTMPKGMSLVAVITHLIKYAPMDYEEAKKQINSTLDKEINRIKSFTQK